MTWLIENIIKPALFGIAGAIGFFAVGQATYYITAWLHR